MHWDFALILIFLATVIPLLGRRRVQRLIKMPDTTRRDRLTLYGSTIVSQWAATALILWRTSAHGISPDGLGVAVPHILLAVGATVVLTAIVLANQFLSVAQIASNPNLAHRLLPQVALKIFPRGQAELAAFLPVVVTVSICEETIYRGFALSVFRAWPLSSALFGVLASSVLFAVAHLYQGRRGIIVTFVVGCIFATVRVMSSSLVPEMVAHFATDWTAALMLPKALRSASLNN